MIEADGGDVTTPLLTLARQLELALARRRERRALRGARASQRRERGSHRRARCSRTRSREALSALRARGAVVLLVDDLDEAEALFGAILRSAIFADGAAGALLVATASDPEAPALRRLGA